jgi:HSP20 family protein
MLRFSGPFENLEQTMSSSGGRWRGGIMPMDAYEKDGIYTLRFDLPGVDPDAVDVTVEGSTLTVAAEAAGDEPGEVTWLLRERPSGHHRREVRLGEHLDPGRVDASFDNGVLTVTIPMREESKPYRVAVNPPAKG